MEHHARANPVLCDPRHFPPPVPMSRVGSHLFPLVEFVMEQGSQMKSWPLQPPHSSLFGTVIMDFFLDSL